MFGTGSPIGMAAVMIGRPSIAGTALPSAATRQAGRSSRWRRERRWSARGDAVSISSMRCERSLGGEELVEHPPGPALMADIVLAVEDADAVDEDAMDAFRVADGAPPAAGQVGDAAR